MEQTANDLEEVLATEIELAKALLDLHRRKQRVIIAFDGDMLAACLRQEQELLNPLEAVEKERVKLAHAVVGLTTAKEGLNRQLPDSNDRVSDLTERLREVVGQILAVNSLNKTLLEHSREFMRESLRLMTENYSYQLVDRRG